MLVGVGFSHGTLNVTGAKQAAEAVWNMLQIFFADPTFSKFAENEFAIWTESYVSSPFLIYSSCSFYFRYGGHYGPAFASFFLSQNAAIKAGTVKGTILNLKTLGIGNGLTVSLIASNAPNTHELFAL